MLLGTYSLFPLETLYQSEVTGLKYLVLLLKGNTLYIQVIIIMYKIEFNKDISGKESIWQKKLISILILLISIIESLLFISAKKKIKQNIMYLSHT